MTQIHFNKTMLAKGMMQDFRYITAIIKTQTQHMNSLRKCYVQLFYVTFFR